MPVYLLEASGLHKFAPCSMKDVIYIVKSQLFLSLIWVILGSAVLVQQVSATPVASNSIESSTTDDSDEDEKEEVVSVSQAAINSVVGVHLTQEMHQIMEIRFESKNDPETEDKVTLFETEHHRTLFRQVISPNAP